MAYHLKVFFADRDSFAVFNDLKVEHNGLTAQIDHLVLTRWTAYFMESKSVSQVITVNEHGEWGRIHNHRFTPMESPVEQSRRHKETLYSFMTEHRGEFMGKLLGLMTKHFARLLTPMHYVAISTHGQIQGRGRRKFPQVMKADQIPHAILAHHEALNTGLLSLSTKDEDIEAFNKKEFDAVIRFLLKHDVAPVPVDEVRRFAAELPQRVDQPPQGEREASEAELAVAEDDQPVERQFACRKCESKNLAVAHGPYGCYLKCADCGGNTPIVELCQKCSEKLKVSKSGSEYSLVCPKCQQSSPLNVGEAVQKPAVMPAPVSAPQTPKPAIPVQKKPVPSATPSPACPLCGSTMTIRTARHGKNAGGQFWGCNKYPKCKGIVPAAPSKQDS
jgi:ssDNA-binding Zn-finger/Zn-ribbon topoisomerase 1